RGSSRLTLLRLFSRAPCTSIVVRMVASQSLRYLVLMQVPANKDVVGHAELQLAKCKLKSANFHFAFAIRIVQFGMRLWRRAKPTTPAHSTNKYAGSSTSTRLFLVTLNGADNFSSNPFRAIHSQADSKCHG